MHLDLTLNSKQHQGFGHGEQAGHIAAGNCHVLQQVQKLTALQHLHLDFGWLEVPAEALESIQGLSSLQQLTHLSLRGQNIRDIPSAAAHAALGASPRLQELQLSGIPLAAGTWNLLLPSDSGPFPCLHTLEVTGRGTGLSAGDAALLVKACPNLPQLALPDIKQQPELPAPLQQLKGLQGLDVCGVDNECIVRLGQLSGLQRLVLQGTEGATEAGLQYLLSLKQLTQVSLRPVFISGSRRALLYRQQASETVPRLVLLLVAVLDTI
jgi:hypothetical protein